MSSLPDAGPVSVKVGVSATAVTLIARVWVSDLGSATPFVVPSSLTVKEKLAVPLAFAAATNFMPWICASE